MIITKTCNTCEHFPNDKHCIGCLWDKDKKENTKWELKENPIVIERKVLNQIRGEIADLDDAEYEFEGYYKAVNDALQIIDKYIGGKE